MSQCPQTERFALRGCNLEDVEPAVAQFVLGVVHHLGMAVGRLATSAVQMDMRTDDATDQLRLTVDIQVDLTELGA